MDSSESMLCVYCGNVFSKGWMQEDMTCPDHRNKDDAGQLLLTVACQDCRLAFSGEGGQRLGKGEDNEQGTTVVLPAEGLFLRSSVWGRLVPWGVETIGESLV